MTLTSRNFSIQFILFIWILIGSLNSDELKKYSYSQRLMGIDVLIHLYSPSEKKAELVAQKAFKKMEELESIFSDYQSQSEIRRLSGYQVNTPIKVSQELFKVLHFSSDIHKKSNGAFDPSIRPLSILWRQSRFSGRMPPQKLVDKALERVGFENLVLHSDSSSISFKIPSMTLDCGAIAKGAILDEALELLKQNGHQYALVDAGGDMAIGESPPKQNGWIIKIEGLENRLLSLENSSIATSGDRYQNLVLDGHRYSHIIDPRTGQALKDSHQVTVISKQAMLADAMASTLSLMSPKEALTFLAHYPSCEALLVKDRSGKQTYWNSPGFPKSVP